MSRGLLSRNPGDKFKSKKTNHTLILQSIIPYPSNQLQYASNSELRNHLNSLVLENAYYENSPENTKLKAFIMSWFTCSLSNNKRCSIRFVEKLKPNIIDVFVPNQVFNNEYSFDSPSSNKVSCRCTPQDILPDTLIPYSKHSVIEYIRDFIKSDDVLLDFVNRIIKEPFTEHRTPIPKLLEFSAFRDVFCELIHPVIIASDTDEILFSSSKNNGLWDSKVITANGITSISSKGGKYGAEASIKNLIDLDPIQFQWLENCISNGQLLAPYYLAHYLKLISDNELEKCLDLCKLNLVGSIDSHLELLEFSPYLRNLFKTRRCKHPDSVNFVLHLTAAIAHACCDVVTSDKSIADNFSRVLKTYNLKQIYSHLSRTKTEWIFKGFEIKDLTSDENHSVKLSAQKTYSSTQIKGNFTFSIS